MLLTGVATLFAVYKLLGLEGQWNLGLVGEMKTRIKSLRKAKRTASASCIG